MKKILMKAKTQTFRSLLWTGMKIGKISLDIIYFVQNEK